MMKPMLLHRNYRRADRYIYWNLYEDYFCRTTYIKGDVPQRKLIIQAYNIVQLNNLDVHANSF